MSDWISAEINECAWCGAEIRKDDQIFTNRREVGEIFCSKSHRDSSSRALKRLVDAEPPKEGAE